MFLFAMKYWILWLSVWNIQCTNGENVCRNELVQSINIPFVQQSDVLLLCNFKPALLGSDITADIAVVWSHKNTAEDRLETSLLEISLQGGVRIWNNRGGRINTFPKLSASGNFSILLHKVNKSDLGLYSCELFKGTNCRLAYQEVILDTVSHDHSALAQIWPFIAGGASAVLILLVVSLCCSRHLFKRDPGDVIYMNTRFDRRKPNKLNKEKSSRKSTPSQPGVIDKTPGNCGNIYANIQ